MTFIEHNHEPGKPRAIETVYSGYRFRSRLEARFGVFFTALGLDWTYEPEGFDLDGVWYLPDFKVKPPQGEDIWYEIKPRGVETDEKYLAFARHGEGYTFPRTRLLSGDPLDVVMANDFCPRCGFIQRRDDFLYTMEVWPSKGEAAEWWVACEVCDWETPFGGGHDDEPGFMGVRVTPHKGALVTDLKKWRKLERTKIVPAAKLARQARFEHGEKP